MYSVKDLGNEFIPLAINDSGQIAGAGSDTGSTSGLATAFFLDGDELTPIISPVGEEVRVRAINSSGQVVGASRDAVGNDHAFVWEKASGWRNLNPPGMNYGWANGINDAGVIVGELFGQAAMWKTNGQIHYLGDLGGQYSDAFAVNAVGDVVGLSSLDPIGLHQHAFVLSQRAMHDLGVTDSITPGYAEYASANDINERGQVAGGAVVYSTGAVLTAPHYGYLWSPSSGLETLVVDVEFIALNDAGQAVGIASKNGLLTWNAMLYSGGRLHNINDLIPSTMGIRLTKARDINNAGQIIAWGQKGLDPNEHGFLLTPIPEPATYWMIATALAIGTCRRNARP